MPKALVSYYFRTGNTKKMAARIAGRFPSPGIFGDAAQPVRFNDTR